MRILITIFSLFSAICLANGSSLNADENFERDFISYSVKKSSWLSLSGTTNINSFECRSYGEDSNGEIIIITDQGNGVSFSDAGLVLDVKTFDCENKMITRDMHKALGGTGDSGIEIKLLDAVTGEMNWYSANGKIKTKVIITLNDISVTKELDISWQRTGGFDYQFGGTTELLMSEFEIDPPSPALGLVKVDDRIIVNFNYNVQTSAISRID